MLRSRPRGKQTAAGVTAPTPRGGEGGRGPARRVRALQAVETPGRCQAVALSAAKPSRFKTSVLTRGALSSLEVWSAEVLNTRGVLK